MDLRLGEPAFRGELRVDLFHAFADEPVDFRLLRQIGIAGVGQATALGPVAHRSDVDVDERAYHVAAVAEHHGFLDVRKELELVLDVVRREHRAVGELADILGAVDDLELAAGIEQSRVAGMEVAFGVDRFRRRIGPLVVFLEQHRPPHQHLARLGDLYFDAGRRDAHGVEFHAAIGLQAYVRAGLRRSVQLLEIDADRPVETEQVRPDGRAGGVGDPDAAHAEHVAQRRIDEKVAEPVRQPIGERDGPPVEDFGAARLRHRHEVVEDSALDGAGVFHADHDLRQQILEDPWRRKIIRRPDLAHVRHYGVAGFRAVDRETRDHCLRIGEQVVADPRHRQVGQDALVRREPVELNAALRRGDQRGVGLAHAFRPARRARRVQHDRDVVGPAFRDFRFIEARVGAVVLAPDLLQPLETCHAPVIAQAAWIVVVDVRQRRDLRLRLEQLVDLLLVLGHRVGDFRVVQDVDDVRGRRVLVHRYWNTAQCLRRCHRPVQPRTIVADDRKVHAALEAASGEAAGQRPHFRRDLAPVPGLPDTEVLFPRCRMARPHLGVVQQETRKRVDLLLHPLLRAADCLPFVSPV